MEKLAFKVFKLGHMVCHFCKFSKFVLDYGLHGIAFYVEMKELKIDMPKRIRSIKSLE